MRTSSYVRNQVYEVILFKSIQVNCFYCILFISLEYSHMAEQVKRGLRPKRPPKYRGSDEQDPENPSLNRPNYAKLSVPSHAHEYVSPSVILNHNAKLLVKFINKSNKYTRDIRLQRQQSQREANKKENSAKEKMSVEPVQTVKKQAPIPKNQKTQPPKKNKQLYNFKGLHQNTELLRNITQEQVLKGVKGMESLSGLINNKGIYSGPLSTQLSQLQSLYPCLKDLNYQTLTQSPNPNLFQFNQQSPQSGSKLPPNQSSSFTAQNNQPQPPKMSANSGAETPRGRPQRQSKASQPARDQKSIKTSDKIFKRSAYHVAIAYHIYLKGLQARGITQGNQFDPTYKARLIKEQAGMTNDED